MSSEQPKLPPKPDTQSTHSPSTVSQTPSPATIANTTTNINSNRKFLYTKGLLENQLGGLKYGVKEPDTTKSRSFEVLDSNSEQDASTASPTSLPAVSPGSTQPVKESTPQSMDGRKIKYMQGLLEGQGGIKHGKVVVQSVDSLNEDDSAGFTSPTMNNYTSLSTSNQMINYTSGPPVPTKPPQKQSSSPAPPPPVKKQTSTSDMNFPKPKVPKNPSSASVDSSSTCSAKQNSQMDLIASPISPTKELTSQSELRSTNASTNSLAPPPVAVKPSSMKKPDILSRNPEAAASKTTTNDQVSPPIAASSPKPATPAKPPSMQNTKDGQNTGGSPATSTTSQSSAVKPISPIPPAKPGAATAANTNSGASPTSNAVTAIARETATKVDPAKTATKQPATTQPATKSTVPASTTNKPHTATLTGSATATAPKPLLATQTSTASSKAAMVASTNKKAPNASATPGSTTGIAAAVGTPTVSKPITAQVNSKPSQVVVSKPITPQSATTSQTTEVVKPATLAAHAANAIIASSNPTTSTHTKPNSTTQQQTAVSSSSSSSSNSRNNKISASGGGIQAVSTGGAVSSIITAKPSASTQHTAKPVEAKQTTLTPQSKAAVKAATSVSRSGGVGSSTSSGTIITPTASNVVPVVDHSTSTGTSTTCLNSLVPTFTPGQPFKAKFCYECGYKFNNASEKFCSECGTKRF